MTLAESDEEGGERADVVYFEGTLVVWDHGIKRIHTATVVGDEPALPFTFDDMLRHGIHPWEKRIPEGLAESPKSDFRVALFLHERCERSVIRHVVRDVLRVWVTVTIIIRPWPKSFSKSDLQGVNEFAVRMIFESVDKGGYIDGSNDLE